MRKLLLAVVVIIAATAVWAIPAMAAPPAAPFNQCPAVGLDTSCGVLIVVNPGGSLTILTDPTQPPYDGVEDTLIGVLNSSGGPITSISLTGTSGAFGFDGDGLCNATPHPAGCPFATTGPGPDYAGPGTGFANIANGGNDGDVTFSPALADGASTYFSLEGPASAVTGGTIGHIEICKTLGSAGLVGVSPAANVTTPPTASFEYTVTDGAGTQTVVVRANAPGGGVACSAPITVHGSPAADGTFTVSVAETVPTWASISALSYTTNYNGATTNVSPIVNPVTVPVLADGSIAQETRIDYTNVLVTGLLEVCKAPAPHSGLASGQFSFRIRGGANPLDHTVAFDQTIAVSLNGCSAPIAVPAGTVNVQETGLGVFVTDVTLGPANPGTSIFGTLNSDNSVDVMVAASPANETLVRFFDALSTLKLCKIGGIGFTGPVTFTVTGAAGATGPVTVVAGPAPGNCIQIPGAIVPGSTISVVEAPTVGAMVEDIDLNGTTLTAPQANLATGTATFAALNGANVLTYENVLAPPVLVKICKAGAAAGSTIALSINGVLASSAPPSGFRGTASTMTGSILIPSTGGTACTDTLGPFAYGSTLAVTETPPAGTGLTGATVTGNAGPTATVAGSTASITVGAFGSTASLAILTLTNGTAPVVPPPVAATGGKVNPSGNNTSSGGGSSNTSAGGVAAAAPSPASATSLTATPTVVSLPKLSAKLVRTKLLTVKQHGLLSRWLGVQLTGTASSAKVRIQLIGANGKVIGTMNKTIKTGKLVRVLKLGAAVRSIKVTALPTA